MPTIHTNDGKSYRVADGSRTTNLGERMLKGATFIAKNPDYKDYEVFLEMGYSEYVAKHGRYQYKWYKGELFNQLVELLRPYYALRKVKDMDKLAEATKSIEIAGALGTELIKRIADGELESMPIKDLISAHSKMSETAFKNISGLTQESKKALVTIENIKEKTANHLRSIPKPKEIPEESEIIDGDFEEIDESS